MSPLVRSPNKDYRGGQDDTPDQQATSQPTLITYLRLYISFPSAISFSNRHLLSLFEFSHIGDWASTERFKHIRSSRTTRELGL